MSAEFKRKIIAATQQENQVMKDYFLDLDAAAKNPDEKIAWCTSVGPAELLRGMGFKVHFPENHGAMLGATRMSTELIDVAVADGFSPNVCSYMNSDIGSFLSEKTPLRKAYGIDLPKPDVLVYNTSQCRDVQDWFEWYGRRLGVPALGMRTPRGIIGHDEDLSRAGTEQLKAMVPQLEEIIGRKMDIDRLRETIQSSRQTSDLWNECLKTNVHTPAPWTFFDSCIHMGPAVVLRGEPAASDYYRVLLKELKEKIAKNDAAVEGERHRLFWVGIPVWGRIGAQSKLFGQLAANIIASTYCSSWVFETLDAANPLESLGETYTQLYIAGDDTRRMEFVRKSVEEYNIDGMVYHDAWTCAFTTECRYGLPARLREASGIPYIVINGDLNDLRCYSDEQTSLKVEAFIEELEGI